MFGPLTLAETAKVSVNPKTMRPYYLGPLGASFDGTANLPLIYMVTVEDSSEAMVSQLVDPAGKLKDDVEIPLPVEGLLNPELAHRFDDFTEKNSAYSLSPATIAGNLDKDFETLHPTQLQARRARPLLFERHHREQFDRHRGACQGAPPRKRLAAHLDRAGGVFQRNARAGAGLWSSEKATQEFHINTDDLEAARQGVSSYEQHALIPHEAYQALYAAGEAQKVFGGYKVHILSKGQVISDV